jgi:hypothetical protein
LHNYASLQEHNLPRNRSLRRSGKQESYRYGRIEACGKCADFVNGRLLHIPEK